MNTACVCIRRAPLIPFYIFPPTATANEERKERDRTISTIHVTTGGKVEDEEL
jgi:hypothetical protein